MRGKVIIENFLNKEQLKNYKFYFIDTDGNLCKRHSPEEKNKIEPINEKIEKEMIKKFEEEWIEKNNYDEDEEFEKEIEAIQSIRKSTYSKVISEAVIIPKENCYYIIDEEGNVIEIDREEEEIEFQNKIKENKSKPLNEWDYDVLLHFGFEYLGDFYGRFGEPETALKYFIEALNRKKEKPQPTVLKATGSCYEKLSNFEEAIKYYEWALKRYPQYKSFSSIPDHIEFCKKKMLEKEEFNFDDWTEFINSRRQRKFNLKF